MAEVDSVYNPLGSRDSTEKQGGTGLDGGKVPLAGLWIFGSNKGIQYLPYSGLVAGSQSPDGNRFWFYYRGIIEDVVDGKRVGVFGAWLLTAEGTNLQSYAYRVGNHLKPELRVGEKENVDGKLVIVREITIETGEIVMPDEDMPGVMPC